MAHKDIRINIYIKQIKDSINAIKQHIGDTKIEQIEKHHTILDACLMQLIHIGEIMNKINKRYPDFKLDGIDINRVIGLRNFIAHEYLGININIIKRILSKNIPELEKMLNKK